jgi:DNA-binding XRE family transcriptional regulator
MNVFHPYILKGITMATACEIFKRKFKELRMKSGLTQDKLAVELELSRSCIKSWENGSYNP